MPSFMYGGRSGGDPLFAVLSGNPYSGFPQIYGGGIQLRVDRSASGNLYLGFSGAVTVQSGTFFQSGASFSGMNDGIQLGPGDAFLVPPSLLGSGNFNMYFAGDPAASGFARVYWYPIPVRP